MSEVFRTLAGPCWLAMLALLSGCGLGERRVPPDAGDRLLRAPQVVFVALHSQQRSRAGLPLFLIELDLINPNGFALMVRGVDVELGIDGARVVRGLSNQPLAVPAHGIARSSIEAVMTERDRVRLINTRFGSEARYAVSGRVYLGNRNAISSVPF